MRVEKITFTDYNDVERTEEFRFNLNEAELAELEMSRNGGVFQYLQRLLAKQDMKNMSKFFKDILLKSYGEKTEDGRRFIKSRDLSTDFSQTEAYNILYVRLVSEPDFAAAFLADVLPKNVKKRDEVSTELKMG